MRMRAQTSRRTMLWRGLWALVLLLHAPITVSVFAAALRLEEGRASWSSLLILAISNAFFIVEILFAYSLRLLRDRRAVFVFFLVIALLHVGVIERGFPALVANLDQPVAWLLLGVVGTMIVPFFARQGLILAIRRWADSLAASILAVARRYSSRPANPILRVAQIQSIPFAAHRGPPRR